MDRLWQWMKEDLTLARRAPITVRIYLAAARDFAAFHSVSQNPGPTGGGLLLRLAQDSPQASRGVGPERSGRPARSGAIPHL